MGRQHNVVRAIADGESPRGRQRLWHAHAEETFWSDLGAKGLDDGLESLTNRAAGDVVTDARSSWVRSRRIGPKNVYVKTYDYSSPSDRRRGWGRTTWLARSRARREWDALRWFVQHGFHSVTPLLVAELRTRKLRVLHRACIVTEAWGDGSLDALLPTLDADSRIRVLEAVGQQVHAWHAAGWRDRNLDPRNLLVDGLENESATDELRVAKIDSPRFRLAKPTPRPADTASRHDWERLNSGLDALGITDHERGSLGATEV